MSKRIQELAPDAAWTKGKLSSGVIMVGGKPMPFWLPSGVYIDDVFPHMRSTNAFDDSDQTPFDDESGLVDDDEVAA